MEKVLARAATLGVGANRPLPSTLTRRRFPSPMAQDCVLPILGCPVFRHGLVSGTCKPGSVVLVCVAQATLLQPAFEVQVGNPDLQVRPLVSLEVSPSRSDATGVTLGVPKP